jgi:hypothetical protein
MVTRPIRREMKRRAAVEPVIGHLKAEHRLIRPQLSQGTRRRPQQRRARRRRIQLQPSPALAGEAFACPNPGPLPSATPHSIRLNIATHPFFTDDYDPNNFDEQPIKDRLTRMANRRRTAPTKIRQR